MKIYDLDEDNAKSTLKITDFDNFFNVYMDEDSNLFFNLNSTLYFSIPSSQLESYTVSHPMHWPLVSYLIYSTTRLAWLLMKINGVDAKNVFQKKQAGDKVKYLPMNIVQEIVKGLNGQS